jgi:hypothetical protein
MARFEHLLVGYITVTNAMPGSLPLVLGVCSSSVGGDPVQDVG